MKKLFVALLIVLSPTIALAGNTSLAALYGQSQLVDKDDSDRAQVYAAALSVRTNDYFSIEGRLVRTTVGEYDGAYLYAAQFSLHAHPFGRTKVLDFYYGAGAGPNWLGGSGSIDTSESYLSWHGGIGLNIGVKPGLGLTVDARYVEPLSNDFVQETVQLTSGLVARF